VPEEHAFLAALAADPGDDLTRQVYADWLEENGDARGAYLRAEQELATLDENDPRFVALDLQVRERCSAVDPEWLSVAGRRWDVWLVSVPAGKMISAIKAVREVLSCSLVEGKQFVEFVPACLMGNTHRADAEDVRTRMIASSDSESVTVLIRSCAAPIGAPRTYQPPTYYETYLQGPRPGQNEPLMQALQALFQWTSPRTAPLVLAKYLPYKLGQYASESLARAAAESLEEFAMIEVRRVVPPAVTVRPLLVPTPAVLGKGPFEVRLTSYPRERKIDVIRAYREVTGCGIAAAKQWSEQVPPLVILTGIDRNGAECVRNKFAGLGAIEVRDRASP
jgi:uncharacterized protein (TIGR02996 family)